ncbi:MAG: hypothetical protein QOE03_2371 [Micromonosporaceae bacterium]|nr:hypothetical protein [Micromonosporaceae bacterium]
MVTGLRLQRLAWSRGTTTRRTVAYTAAVDAAAVAAAMGDQYRVEIEPFAVRIAGPRCGLLATGWRRRSFALWRTYEDETVTSDYARDGMTSCGRFEDGLAVVYWAHSVRPPWMDVCAVRALVVGGTGFLGQHVVGELRRRGHRVTVLVRTPGAEPVDGVETRTGDATELTVEAWADLLAGHDGPVFAAGVDDRVVPPAPAADFLARVNVTPLRRLMHAAVRAGCSRAVVLGSYFTTMNRQRPDLRLAQRHPYIRSRVEQMRAARAAAGVRVPVACIEIPFVVGRASGRRSVFAPAVPWLASRVPLVAPRGGTAVVSSRAVAEAVVGAFERAAGGDFPVVEENLSWHELLRRLAEAAGRRPPVRVWTLPRPFLSGPARAVGWAHRLRGREPGVAAAHVAELFTQDLFLDPAVSRDELGVSVRGLDEPLRDTVAVDR